MYRRWDCTGGRRTAYVCDALFEKGRYGERPYRTDGGIVQAVAVPPMYAMLSLKKGATASARTTQSLYRTEPVRTRKLI